MIRRIMKVIIITALLNGLWGCSQHENPWISYKDISFSPSKTWEMIEDRDGNLWIATLGDVHLYERATGKWSITLKVGELDLGRSQTLAVGPDDTIWVGTDRGLGYYNSAKEWHISTDLNSMPDKDVRAILFDSYGNMWLGMGHGEIYISKNNGLTWDNLTAREDFSFTTIRALYEDSRGLVWIIGNTVYQYDLNKNQWSDFKSIFADITVWSIHEDSNGHIWFGTFEDGAIRYDSIKNEWSYFTTSDGLVDNNVKSIASDTSNNIWFGANNGISIYNPSLDEWTTFDKENGFTNFSSHSILVDSQGQIWVGTFGYGIYQYQP